MLRRIPAAILLSSVSASAQVVPPGFRADDIQTNVLSCEETGESISCVTTLETPVAFCMAVDAEGAPVANSTSVSATGVVTFQGLDPSRITALRCRPI